MPRVKARLLAIVAVFTGLSIALRVAKNLFTQIQFVNIPLAFAMLGGLVAGSRAGFTIGLLAFLLSDLVLAPGPWTPTNSLLAGVIGYLWGFANRLDLDKSIVFVLAFLSTFAYDIVSSVVFYLVLGMPPLQALELGLLGLFLPAGGGYMLGVGPVTEISTALLTSSVYWGLKRRGVLTWVGSPGHS